MNLKDFFKRHTGFKSPAKQQAEKKWQEAGVKSRGLSVLRKYEAEMLKPSKDEKEDLVKFHVHKKLRKLYGRPVEEN